MRIKILILSSLILLAFFAIAAHAFSDSTGKTADQLISGDQEVTTQAGQANSPQASRATQIGQKAKDILSVPLGGKLDVFGYNPKDTRSQDLSQTTSPVQNASANKTVSAPVQVAALPEPTSVSGSWSLELTDSASRTAVLTLFQSGDAVYGSGNVNLDANTTMMAASGTLTGSELNLDLITLGKVNLYRLTLMVSGESATGNYTAYSPSSSPSTGTAKGTRSALSS